MKTLLSVFLSLILCSTFLAASPKKTEEKKDVAANINEPRSDARKISFQTSEGTWMSVDISPDGKTLVFDLLGDIYSMPVTGGQATALSTGPAYDDHPRFSPDGRTIAFSSDRNGLENVWLMDADGKNPRVLTDGKDAFVRSAAWATDGKYLIARKEDAKHAHIPPQELWMYSIYGGSGIKLISSDDVNNSSGPVASPDGRYIYFSARQVRFDYEPNLSGGLWQIMRYDRETGETAALTEGFGGAVRPAISHDGQTLIFISRRDSHSVMVSRNLATGAEKILLADVTQDEQEGFSEMDLWPNYAFTPDDSALIYSDHGKIRRLDLQSGQAAEIPFTVNVDQWVAPRVAWEEKLDMGPVHARILRWSTQSPDGHWILFDAFGRIWLQEISGASAVGAPRRLTSDSADLPQREYSPAFSPDGKWIVYVTWSDAEGGHIWKAPVPAAGQTSVPQKLTKAAGHYINPEFSPQSDRILAVRGTGLEFRERQPEEDSYFDVGWVPANGGDFNFVTTVKVAESLKYHPQVFWNADGTRIYLRDPIERAKSSDDVKNDLVSVRLDGTDKKKLLRFPAVSDLIPSPDEQWVAFVSRDNVYVAALPKVQLKEPPEVDLTSGAVAAWRLSDEAGSYVAWADGGKTITWTLANVFHRLPVSGAIQFAEEQKKKEAEKAKEEESKSKSKSKSEETEKKEGPKVPGSETITIALDVPRSIPQGSVVFRGARVITMKGDEVLENADVVTTNNRIVAVGASGTLIVPAGAKEIDAHGKTIMPGIVDTHAHLHYSGFELFPDNKWEYIANLAYGVTTVYDPSAPSLDVFGQAEMVESGAMTGPRVYSSGDILYGGQQEDFYAQVDSQEDADRQIKRMKAYGARMVKVYQQPRRDQRMWLAEACRNQHMLITAEGGGELNTDLTMTMDGYTAFEHALPVELFRDAVELVAKSGTHYTPTLMVAYGGPWGEEYFFQNYNPHDDAKLNRFVPHLLLDSKSRRHVWIWPDEYHFPTVAQGVAQVAHEGGNISLGGHGELQGLGPHWELWMMAGEAVPNGKPKLTPLETLRAVTLGGADKIGFAPDLGSIESGKLADLVVLNANPLEDIHNTVKIQWVMKNGVLYDAETMNEEWPQQLPLPKFFWNH
jgi:Tol biopolymer transport system component/imidazolonepropionase-like amidohydrolase